MPLFQAKVSVVVVVGNSFRFDALCKLDDVLSRLVAKLDYVLVVNGVNEATASLVLSRINEIPDTTAHFLPEQVEEDFARLIGLDNAVGDWVLCIGDLDVPINAPDRLFAHESEAIDHISLYAPAPAHEQGALYNLLSSLYLKAYHRLTGLSVERGPCGTDFYSRAAAQYILHHRGAEMLLHSRSLGAFFPSIAIEDAAVARPATARSTAQGLARGWRILMRSTTAPLRFVTAVAIGSCVANLFYAIVVVVIRLFKSNVAAGWATLSLQASVMFFVISLLLALIGEYLIQIDRGVNHRLRYAIIREIRSTRSRLEGKRNVVTAAG